MSFNAETIFEIIRIFLDQERGGGTKKLTEKLQIVLEKIPHKKNIPTAKAVG